MRHILMSMKWLKILKTEAYTKYGNLKSQYYKTNNPKPQIFLTPKLTYGVNHRKLQTHIPNEHVNQQTTKLRTKISTKRLNYDSKWNRQQKQPTQTQQSKQKHVWTQYISNHSNNSKNKKIILKTWNMKWGREDPYLFLEDLRRNEAKMEFVESDMECLG